jgi:hypothetical protein
MNARERLETGQAWDDFCDTLKQAGRIIDRFPREEIEQLDRAEWYRFLSRLTRNGLERFLENREPDRPRLRDVPWRQAINFQSPDQDHLLAEFVDGSHDYVIRGNRGGLPYFVIASWRAPVPVHPGEQDWAAKGIAGLQEFNPALYQTTAFINSDTVHFDADGNFTIFVGQNRNPDYPDFLPITPDCVGLLVRTLHHDRANTKPPVFTIERVDNPEPRPLLAEEAADGLATAGQVVLAFGELVRSWWQDNLAKRPNRIRFDEAVYLSNGGVPDRHHGFGTWEVAADEALVIDFMPTECHYWIFQLCSIWQENLDNYEDGDGYVTKYHCTYRDDSSVRVIVSQQEPGIAGNHISPFGHLHGCMSLRLIGVTGDPPAVTLRRISVALLKEQGEAALERIEPIISGELNQD